MSHIPLLVLTMLFRILQANFLSRVSGWMDKESSSLKQVDFGNEGSWWNGTDFVAAMISCGITQSELEVFAVSLTTSGERLLTRANTLVLFSLQTPFL
jgi:hypothetical protein